MYFEENVEKTTEELELEVAQELYCLGGFDNYDTFSSFEVDPDDDEDIYIPGTDEKIN
jgi:hypothetical protein